MPHDSLYRLGWRQGSLVQLRLTAVSSLATPEGIGRREDTHERWIVCSQDCDLEAASPVDNEPVIELRPVVPAPSGAARGIRSRRYLVGPGEAISSDAPRHHVSPAVLAVTRPAGRLSRSVAMGLKTWLGLRYNRPAVPDTLLALAKAISEEVRTVFQDEVHLAVWDVFMDFDEAAEPTQYALYAVVAEPRDSDLVATRLADAAMRVPVALGVCRSIEVGTKEEAPISLLEDAYVADTTQLTWGGAGGPDLPAPTR